MGFQLLYWSYLQDIKHPVLALLDSSPASFVGEDIELSLSLLSNYTSTTNLARETDPLHESYQKLSLLMHIAHKVRDYRISHFGVQVNDERDCSSKSLSCSGLRPQWRKVCWCMPSPPKVDMHLE